MVHRISGLLLAAFLPVHFWILGKVITSTSTLNTALQWFDNPWAKFAETGLILLLAIHLTGGIRVLMIEAFPWRDWQKTVVALSGGASVGIALAFLLRAF